jgi:hypothetical protein
MTLLPTHAFAAKSDTDCEPAYPCEEFQDVDVWGNDDSGADEYSASHANRYLDNTIDRNVTMTDALTRRVEVRVPSSHWLNIHSVEVPPDDNGTIVDDCRGVQHSVEVPPDDNDTMVDDSREVRHYVEVPPDDNDTACATPTEPISSLHPHPRWSSLIGTECQIPPT